MFSTNFSSDFSNFISFFSFFQNYWFLVSKLWPKLQHHSSIICNGRGKPISRSSFSSWAQDNTFPPFYCLHYINYHLLGSSTLISLLASWCQHLSMPDYLSSYNYADKLKQKPSCNFCPLTSYYSSLVSSTATFL